MNEESLIEGIKKREETAFTRLVQEYQYLVTQTCYGFVHDMQYAEDLAQDVFLEVFRSIDSFRGDAKLSTWLYRIAVNKSLNHVRKNKKHRLLRSIEGFFGARNDVDDKAIELPSGGEDIPDEVLHREQRRKRIEQAIDSLPENQKIVFTLHKYDEMPYKEIAEVMGVSLSSVESLLFRARKNLQKNLLTYYRQNEF